MTYGADMDIANTYGGFGLEHVPDRYEVFSHATYADLQAAGFHGGPNAEAPQRPPGSPPSDELLVPGPQTMTPQTAKILAAATYSVLCDEDGEIVATWDEGRWWTPEESDAFTAAIVAERKKGVSP